MKKTILLPACAVLFVLAGCSDSTTTTKKESEKPPEPITGQSALWKMFQSARTWSSDIQVLRMSSIPLAEAPQVPGKSGAWQATFTSAEKGRMKPFTYSIVETEGNLHKGVFGGLEEPYSGPADAPFLIAAVKVDTDAAYKTAKTKAADYEKKNPGKPISFLLERNKKYPNPSWRVIWGESVGTSDFSVFIDASTGEYLETVH